MKNFLPKQLRMMLNALEAQHFREYMSFDDKQAALETLLADNGPDGQPQPHNTAIPLTNASPAGGSC
ncbi:hypothetical protein VSS37_10070 [Candidatus Thiothrix sp. Deng01]|uniref:Uncharacterized protein n=1 Tax=Candidatus Thiothrix phosphatis TaxID=3112415 RepID=A0ABU6CWW4_9GAMM|nr:hypothetical protein [Candidatus Thiothrix sp. Deng01]MEB4591324.1 hypothetical protein [Candidatus Thiothrix sp. Deng01]